MLACDGLFKVFTPEEAVNFILSCLEVSTLTRGWVPVVPAALGLQRRNPGPPSSHVPGGSGAPSRALTAQFLPRPHHHGDQGAVVPRRGCVSGVVGRGSLFTSAPSPLGRMRRSSSGKGSPPWTPATKPPATGWPTKRCSGARRTTSR